ncbi:MAG TPA: carbohydrate ABC transporter permease [Ktedonobacteraceae bacterium]|nr:carbohydrate ABC transporter permease [Ktedonobacteraceae bacterium]
MKSAISAPILNREQYIQRRRKALTVHKAWQEVGARIFLLLMSVLFLIPLYWMIVTALKSNPELALVPPTLLPQSWQWGNFPRALHTIPFATYFMNSVIITVLSVAGAVISNLIVAYGFACIEWPGRNIVFYLVLATIFIPFPLAIIPQFDMFARLHWINTYLPLIVPSFFGNAFFIFLIRQFLLQIPRDLLDVARIDGASEWRILWQIVAPLARPALVAVAIFACISAWNDFLGPLIYLQDSSVQTLSIGLQAFRSTHDIQFNLLMATSFMVVLPLIVLFIALQRFFISGITPGSIR